MKGDVGRLYVLLVDPDTLEAVPGLQDAANVSNGLYNFSIGNVPAGTYLVYAGSDPDNDTDICDTAEACGAYLTLDNPSVITVDGNLSGNNFNVQFNVSVPPQSLTSGASTVKPLYIKKDTEKTLLR